MSGSSTSKNGVRISDDFRDNLIIDRYDPAFATSGHRPDQLANLRGVTLLTWPDVAAVLPHARYSIVRTDERHYAERALEWMRGKGLVGQDTRAGRR